MEQLQKQKDALNERFTYLSQSINTQNHPTAGKGQKKKPMSDEEQQSILTEAEHKNVTKKRTLQQIMLEADPTCTRDIAEKFNSHIIDVIKTL